VQAPSDSLGREAWEALRRLVRERLAHKPGAHLIEADLERVELRLSLALAEQDPREFVERLVASIDGLLDDAVQRAAAFRPGHAWCHRCDRADCDHSLPPGSRHVFVGYAPTGSPRWEDFSQVCLEARHPEVDRLFEQPPRLLTLVQDRAWLQQGILSAFRNGSYELLGQVTAGFYRAAWEAILERRGAMAVTFQAGAWHSGKGRLRVGLNVLGRTPDGEVLDVLTDRPWQRAVRWAQAALRTLERPAARVKGRSDERRIDELDPRVLGILRGLARRLEHDQRARGRRTRHAEQRHVSGERPTRKAVDDARAAGADAVMVDERSGTVVVLGERGRTHFFTRAGQHVSSVRYSREAIARKIKLERWRTATSDELDRFRECLTAPAGPGDALGTGA